MARIFLALMIVACAMVACAPSSGDSGDSGSTAANESKPAGGTDEASNEEGKKLFTQYCAVCHGPDGKLGLNGAKDLTVSETTLEERIEQVTHGKNAMVPFENVLTKEQIEAVAKYTMTLKQ
ncbi:MAG: cytochrome c [Saprospiraceae bacterium]|nr:cytochrome c [Saprospiraceae bacterium]